MKSQQAHSFDSTFIKEIYILIGAIKCGKAVEDAKGCLIGCVNFSYQKGGKLNCS
jgi:hypothetical protein